MSGKVRSWKYAATVALTCTGVVAAAVVGVRIHKYRYVDRGADGNYRVRSEDGRNMISFSENHVDNPEQAVEYAEEIALLKQQGNRELVLVSEREVNGQHDSRMFTYEYNLPDGRTIYVGERDPDDTGPRLLVSEQLDELIQLSRSVIRGGLVAVPGGYIYDSSESEESRRLKKEGRVEFLDPYEQVVQGRVFFFFEPRRFVLNDGTEVVWSIGRLSEDNQSAVTTGDSDVTYAELTRNDLREIWILREQDKRQLIGVDELVANGELDRRVFVYQYQLSDGRTMDMREGTGGNYTLNKKQRQEWVQCRDTGSGEDLGTYEEKVKDRLFVFKRQRFALSDGTEVIWSVGKPKY